MYTLYENEYADDYQIYTHIPLHNFNITVANMNS